MFKNIFKRKKTSEFGRILKSRNDVIAYHIYCNNFTVKGVKVQHA